MYMNEDDYNSLDNADKALYNYTHNEQNIFNPNMFEALLEKYPNKEDMVVFRGINFSSRLKYHKFMKRFNEEGGYFAGRASGFAPSEETAMGFAESEITYFPTEDTISAESDRMARNDKMTGFCGVILKAHIKAGEGVDVRLSGLGVEDEILLAPVTKIKCEIEVIDNYHTIVNGKDFDLNEYIQSCNDLEDPILNYITLNYSERVNNDSANHLFNVCTHFDDEQTKRENLYDSDLFKEILFDDGAITIGKEEKNVGRSFRDRKMVSTYHVALPDMLLEYERRGCFRPEQYRRLKAFSSNVVNTFIKEFKKLDQSIEFETLKGIGLFSQFTDEYTQNKYQKDVLNRHGRNIKEISSQMRELNDQNLSGDEMKEQAMKMGGEISDLLTKIISERTPNMKKKSKRLSGDNGKLNH